MNTQIQTKIFILNKRLFFGIWLFVVSCFIGFACKKEQLSLPVFREISVPVSGDDLTSVWFSDSLHGVVTGGVIVYPSEVVAVLLAHPAVAEAAVYGVSDPEWGRRVHAAVVPKAGAVFDAAALEAWCRARLAGYKRPRAIVAVPRLPRTASGKLRRHVLATTVPAFGDSEA